MNTPNHSQQNVRLAIDIGGTFTDLALAAHDRLTTLKVLTTPEDPSLGVLEGIAAILERADLSINQVDLIIHGTTLATNALIERRGAKTAFLTTEGHRDVLEMAAENRFEQYDINIDRPEPLAPRYLRLPIRERMNRHGEPLIPLSKKSVEDCLPILDSEGVESVAIGFLHGYANPKHEEATAAILAKHRPNLSLTLASSVAPEIREFERFSTACANAYVRPLMERYLRKLEASLRVQGLAAPIMLMTSGGGLTTLDIAARYPIRLVESGPAGGAVFAAEVARECDAPNVMAFDMGGTTAKLCLIDDFAPQHARAFEVDRAYRFKKGSGLPVRVPVIEMVEIGAGGGSIARVDALSRINVGPESAGSDPGPACYGRGGVSPTVTDADLLLDRLSPTRFAGGQFNLDKDKSASAFKTEVSDVLGLNTDFAAFGVSETVDENMSEAARAHAAEWGKDFAERALIATGGAAPLHAARLGEKLRMDTVIVPVNAGVGSAIGFLLAPVSFEVVRSRFMTLGDFDRETATQIFASLYEEADAVVSAAAPDAPISALRQAHMRYRGQGYEIAVTMGESFSSPESVTDIRTAFEDAYKRLYGRIIPNAEVEILTWTLRLTAQTPATEFKPPENADASDATRSVRSVFDSHRTERMQTAIYERDALDQEMTVNGPALIVENQTTTVVSSRYIARLSDQGHIVMRAKGDQDE